MDNYLQKNKNFALDLLFPKFCFGCQKEGTYLCDDCRALLDICEFNYCLCENNPNRLLPNQKTGKCNRCSDRKLSGLYFALSFNLPTGRQEKNLTKKLIHSFKYCSQKDLAKTLASILIEHFIKTGKNTNEIWENSVLIPVPLDKTKIKSRGYNQSEELANELSKILNVPVLADVLIKTKKTAPQMELKKQDREKNLLGAFKISTTCHSGESQNPKRLQRARNNTYDLCNKKIFLVDDVYTTGSTMSECAKVLRKAGAKQVWGICIAREG